MMAALGFKKPTTSCVATLHLLFKRLDRDRLESLLGQESRGWLLEKPSPWTARA